MSGVNSASSIYQVRGDEPPVSFEVAVPSSKPTRSQIAEDFYAHFGFSREDMDFLKERFRGTDPFAYFANTLEYDPHSVTTENGQTKVRLAD
ncbi:MAG: hypothetical protein WKF30_08905 [Pyrinomonadaceae bacterium]